MKKIVVKMIKNKLNFAYLDKNLIIFKKNYKFKIKNNKRNIVELTITNLGINGEGVARHNGKVIFVPMALPNEQITAKILKENKNFCKAQLDKILKNSIDRVNPVCPYFGVCGGCTLQHLNYENQLIFKTNLVEETLKKITNFNLKVLPCVPSSKIYGYRNKISLGFALNFFNKPVLGYYLQNTKSVLPITNCPLAFDWLKPAIREITNFAETENFSIYNFATGLGEIKGVVLREINKHLCITFIAKTKAKINAALLAEKLLLALKRFNIQKISVFLNVDSGKNSNILTGANYIIYGDQFAESLENELNLETGNLGFCQVNNQIKTDLYREVLLNVSPEDFVIDAFSGGGQLSALVARKVQKVVGIEIVKNAWQSAESLKRKNKIKNLENINGDCEEVLPKLLKNFGFKAESNNIVLILDPPRIGVLKNILRAVQNNAVKIKKIIYISCNPISLARNIKELLKNFKVEFIKPFDMFPQTSNVETLVVLTNQKPKLP